LIYNEEIYYFKTKWFFQTMFWFIGELKFSENSQFYPWKLWLSQEFYNKKLFSLYKIVWLIDAKLKTWKFNAFKIWLSETRQFKLKFCFTILGENCCSEQIDENLKWKLEIFCISQSMSELRAILFSDALNIFNSKKYFISAIYSLVLSWILYNALQ
jgi:hypothetical protein